MTILVADVGGTNTRLAIIGPNKTTRDVARYQNDDFASFLAVLKAYASQHDVPEINSFCVAIAGPVTSLRANLTNRDWHFDKAEIAGCLPGLAPGSVHLINDLVALGYALPALTQAQLAEIKPSSNAVAMNDQALVVGLGTGVNTCLVKGTAARRAIIEAELGHASLPSSVAGPLQAAIGAASAEFPSVEELFAGRGLSRLYRVLSGGEQLQGRDILSNYDAGAGGAFAETVNLLGSLLGRLARELIYMYQPFGGIHFAGGVARGILNSAARTEFLTTFDTPGRFAEHIGRVPVRLITDDAAALIGAAEVSLATEQS